MNEHQISFDISQSISCQIDPNKATEEVTYFLHGMCSWIYFGDDDENEDEGEDDEVKEVRTKKMMMSEDAE